MRDEENIAARNEVRAQWRMNKNGRKTENMHFDFSISAHQQPLKPSRADAPSPRRYARPPRRYTVTNRGARHRRAAADAFILPEPSPAEALMRRLR